MTRLILESNRKFRTFFRLQVNPARQSPQIPRLPAQRSSELRLALRRSRQIESPATVIDFTRYDLPAQEPQTLQCEWSLMNVINQRATRPQDKPIRLSQLTPEDQQRIYTRYPELKKLT